MDSILLKNYQPESSLAVGDTKVARAHLPVINFHSHTSQAHVKTAADVNAWVKTIDEVCLERTVVFTGATGAATDAPDYSQRVVRELERCYRKGARGVGEITDKGSGIQRAALAKALDRYPNLFVDLSAREYEIGRQPRAS